MRHPLIIVTVLFVLFLAARDAASVAVAPELVDPDYTPRGDGRP